MAQAKTQTNFAFFVASSSSSVQALPGLKGGESCYVKLSKEQGLKGKYDRIGKDGQEWVGMVEEEKDKWHTETLKQKGEIQSLEVMGHCKWQISW